MLVGPVVSLFVSVWAVVMATMVAVAHISSILLGYFAGSLYLRGYRRAACYYSWCSIVVAPWR